MNTRERKLGSRAAQYVLLVGILLLFPALSSIVPEPDRCPATAALPSCRYENIAYDQWTGGRRYADSSFNGLHDSLNPAKLFPPKKEEYALMQALKAARAQARHWKIEVRLPNGAVHLGRVKKSVYVDSVEHVILDTAPGKQVRIPITEIAKSELNAVASEYDPHTIPLTAESKPSEIARAQGLHYLTHGVTSVEILKEKLDKGALYPMDPERDQWRIANYLELVGPDQMQRVRMRRISLIFDLKALDRSDYFVTPLQNFGTRTNRTVDAGDRPGLSSLFWEIQGGHDTGGNEVVIKGTVSYDHLIAVYIEERDRAEIIALLKASKISPPNGKTWDEFVKASPHFEPLVPARSPNTLQ